MSLHIQSSRFALLNIDDDSDDAAAKPVKKNNPSKSNAAKKNKKKNKTEKMKVENDELRHLAFGLGPTRKGKTADRQHGRGDATAPSDGQWQEWESQDTEFTAESYEKDLQQALLLSKLEMEQQKDEPEADAPIEVNDDSSGKKKKKKNKKKKGTMSLDEFNQPEKPNDLDTTNQTKVPAEADTKFFDRVDDDVTRIVRKEIIQDEYRKHYRVENSQILQYQEAIANRDATIKELKETVSTLQEQLAQTETRNKKLSQMLSKGEMKSKSSMLAEMTELKQVRDELTDEVTSLTTQLEIERSRAKTTAHHHHAEKHEKSKGGKH